MYSCKYHTMDPSFVIALSEAVNAVRRLEDCAEIIVSTVVDDLLLRVSTEYHLDFTTLVKKYKADMLERHAVFATERQRCKGVTAAKKQCTRMAVSGGYCRSHVQQGIEKKEKDKMGEEYAVTQVSKRDQDPVAQSLKRLDIPVRDHKADKVSKTDITDFF